MPHTNVIPKPLCNQFRCKPVVSISKLYKTTANSSYTYQLGNIHPISRLRGDVAAHMREVDNIKSTRLSKTDVEYFPLSIVIYISKSK